MENNYKERLQKEYQELKNRYDGLHKTLIKHDAGTLGYELAVPVDLLRDQATVMMNYLTILEIRAELEGVPLE